MNLITKITIKCRLERALELSEKWTHVIPVEELENLDFFKTPMTKPLITDPDAEVGSKNTKFLLKFSTTFVHESWFFVGLQAGEDAADDEGDKIENIEDTKGYPLLEWVQKPEIRREIKLRFSEYLRTTRDDQGHPIYRDKIKQMVMENKQSLEVDYKGKF